MIPLISIIIPVFNASKYLKICLDSVKNQTYSNIQIICVNDGSTDTSLEILTQYANSDDRFKIVKKSNEGVSLARNSALDVAEGEYILFVDSDDWLEPNTCDIALSAMKKYNTDVVMWSYIREMNGESKNKNIFEKDIYFNKSEVKEKLYRRMFGTYKEETAVPENADALCTVWGKLYKRNIIENNNIRFYDIHKIGTYEDGLFNLEVFRNAESVVFLNEYLYHYRRNTDTSITTAYNPKLYEQWNHLFDILKNKIDYNNLDDSFNIALNNRIVFSLIPLGINEIENKSGKAIGALSKILKSDRYRKAIEKFDLSYLPIHWKSFFVCAKYKCVTGVYLLLLIIQKIRGR